MAMLLVDVLFTTTPGDLNRSHSLELLMSIYVYCYTLSDATHSLEEMVGVSDRNLFIVSYNEVSAIVSAYDHDKLLVKGKDIFCHQNVIRDLMTEATIVPLHFGLTLKDIASVEHVLKTNHDELRDQLHRIYRKVEMEVTMRFAVDDLFDFLMQKHPHLRDEKGKVVGGHLVSYLGDRARKGAKFETILAKEKEIYAGRLKEIVGPWCAEIQPSATRALEREVVTFNCLVNRERLKVFERSIYEAGDSFSSDFNFSFNGPWAPQHFCSLATIEYA